MLSEFTQFILNGKLSSTAKKCFALDGCTADMDGGEKNSENKLHMSSLAPSISLETGHMRAQTSSLEMVSAAYENYGNLAEYAKEEAFLS